MMITSTLHSSLVLFDIYDSGDVYTSIEDPLQGHLIRSNILRPVGIAADDELYIVTTRLCENEFGRKNTKEMTELEQKKLAVMLKNDWYASNAQAARLSGLNPKIVDELFPLAAKNKKR